MEELRLGMYRHYKGKEYEVIGIAIHSETMERLVVYRALYESEFGRNAMWVRPRKEFLAHVFVDGKKVPRFKYIG